MATQNLEFKHPQFTSDPIDIEGNAQTTLAASSVFAQTAALTEGIYDLWTTADCYIAVGPDTTGLITTSGYLLKAGNIIPVLVRKNSKIGAITAAGSATLSFFKVG